MRPILALTALAAALLLIPGCTPGSAADQLVGNWTLDPEAMKGTEEYKNLTDDEKQRAEMMFASMKMELAFTKTDVTMTFDVMGNKQTETNPYTVKSQNGPTMVITSKDDMGNDEEITVVVGADKLTFKQGDESFTMKRMKK